MLRGYVRQRYAELLHCLACLLRRARKSHESRTQGGTCLRRLDARIRHDARERRRLLHRRTIGARNRCGIFHRLADHLDVGVRARRRDGEHIRHVRCLIRRKAERREVVGDDIRRACEVCSSGGGEGEQSGHTCDDLLCIPSGHTKVTHRLRRLLRRELRRLTEAARLCCELPNLIFVGARDCLHLRHSGLELCRCLNDAIDRCGDHPRHSNGIPESRFCIGEILPCRRFRRLRIPQLIGRCFRLRHLLT